MSEDTEDRSGANTLDPVRVERFIKEIERHHEDLLTERMSYMGRCRPIRENIGKVYELASDFGIPKKVLKAKVKERDLQRQIDGIPEDFEEDDRELFEQVTQALGGYADTPLGKAAVDAASKADSKPRNGRKKADQAGEADPDAKAAGDNAERLSAGIKGLPGADAPGKHQVQ